MTLNDGIKSFQKPIASLAAKVEDATISDKLKAFVYSDSSIKMIIRDQAEDEDIDIVVAILRSDLIGPEMSTAQVEKIFNAYVAWNAAVENVCTKLYLRYTFLGAFELTFIY